MSDNLLSYFDPNRDAVIVALESGSEVAVLDRREAGCLGNEILAAARGESTGYEEFLAQQGVEGFEQYLDEEDAAHPDLTAQTCPSCGQPRPFAVARASFLPGTVCGRCGHVAPAMETEQGDYLITLGDEAEIAITDEHGNTVEVLRIDHPEGTADWDAYAQVLGVTRADVQRALTAVAVLDDQGTGYGSDEPDAQALSDAEDACTTHDHEPVGTPWADSPVHPFADPDAATVALGEAEADRCAECGEPEAHWKHHTDDPSLTG